MTKYYCDKCGKETENFAIAKIPGEITAYGGYKTKEVQLCEECYLHISRAEKAYNEAAAKSRMAFYKILAPELYKGETK